MAVRLPATATPNELFNFEYIQVMRQIRSLPNSGLIDSAVRVNEWHQPPLYYTFAALVGIGVPVQPSNINPPPPIEWPRNPAYLSTHSGNLNPVVHITPQNTPLLYTSRIAAALLGVLGLAALYRAGLFVYSPAVSLLMMSLLAFQPNFLHLSGSVNNDVPLTAVSAVVLFYTVLIITQEKGPKWFFGLGLLCAAAILTKASGVFVLAYLAAAVLFLFLREKDIVRTVKSGMYALAGLVPIWAAWLVLNTIRMKDTLGVEISLPVGRLFSLRPADFLQLAPWLDDIWRSFILDWSAGGVGYGPDWFYAIWALFLAFSLLGWLRRPAHQITERRLTLTVLLGFTVISLLFFAVKALTVKEVGYMVPEARWWLPAMPGIAWLAAVGFSKWWPAFRREKAALIAALIPAISVLLLLLLFLPALYPQARSLESVPITEQNVNLIYNDELSLLAAAVDPLIAGQPAQLKLTWQALQDIDQDYIVDVKLLVLNPEGWQILEEQNSYPGSGLSPTAEWLAGDLYQDSILLIPEGELNGPTLTAVSVQLNLAGESVPARRGDVQQDPPLLLITSIHPASPLPISESLAEPVNFSGLFNLEGTDVQREGDDLLVTLWWKAQQELPDDYTIFVHLLDENGRLLTQDDSQPNVGLSPTHIWQKGDVIRDVHRLPAAPLNGTTLLIGAYSSRDGQRIPAAQDGRQLPDHIFRLALER